MATENSRFDCIDRHIEVPKTGITIVPIGDIHFNAPMFAKDVFADWCRKYKSMKDVYFLGVGDYLETLSASERRGISVALHDSSREWMDEQVTQDLEKLAKALEFTRGKWLGMLTGNHSYITGDGETLTQMLARRLDAKPLGVCAAIRLNLFRHGSGTQTNYDIWAHHGRGGEHTSVAVPS